MAIQITQNELKLYKSNIPCKCENCEIVFGISKSDAYRIFKGTKVKKFCSRKCGNLFKTKTSNRECICNQCGTLFLKKLSAISSHNFCSQSCSATFNNHLRKKPVENSPINFHEQQYKNNVELWIAGKIPGFKCRTFQIKRFVRRFLFEKADNKCMKCGWDEIHSVTGNCPLEVNHIDGNASNDRPENLELLCPNCHSLTYNFRALNKNSCRIRNGVGEGIRTHD
jgi:hypothetical protein